MKIIFWIFSGLIMLAPLPFGMVYSVTQAMFAWIVMALVAAYCAIRLKQGRGPAVPLGWILPETIGFFLVLSWGIVQISAFTPRGWHHPLWAEAGRALGFETAGSIGLTPGAGFEMVMRLLTYGAVFWLALQWGRDRKRAGQMLWAVVLGCTGYALYGLIMHLGGFDLVLWVARAGVSGSLSGTFINRNSFATYLGLGLVWTVGLYLSVFFAALDSGRRGRDKILHVLQQSLVNGAPLLACVLILLTALFLTKSRGGVISAMTVLLVMVLFQGFLLRLGTRAYRLVAVTVMVTILGVFFTSGEGWLDRLAATDLDRETRLDLYEQTWQAINRAPLTGYGAGSFEQAFLMFADEKTVNSFKVHNDWLEMIFELGIPGAVVWFAVLGGLGLRCLIGFFRRARDHVYPAAGFCACVLAGMHSLVDFSLQIPAVAVTFAVILGVGVAQSRSSLEE